MADKKRNRRNVHTTLDTSIYKKTRKKAIDLDCDANDLIEIALEKFLQSEPTKEDLNSLAYGG